jgi:hypothetical protein
MRLFSHPSHAGHKGAEFAQLVAIGSKLPPCTFNVEAGLLKLPKKLFVVVN